MWGISPQLGPQDLKTLEMGTDGDGRVKVSGEIKDEDQNGMDSGPLWMAICAK